MTIDEVEIQFRELPFYLTVKMVINRDENIVKIKVESDLHVERVVEMPTKFLIDFVQNQPNAFRAAVLNYIVQRYGLTREEHYS